MTGSGDRIANETDLIQTYLAPLTRGAPGAFELRDDAAFLTPGPGTDLVFTSDPIIAGVHFFPTENAADIAWKALAVNASDLAAKGAQPLAYLLNLALPEAPERQWMSNFAKGLKSAQESFGCYLIGGDTDMTPGPLSIGVTIIGVVPSGKFVPRQGAAKGDHVFVTGTVGDSALGLRIRGDSSALSFLTTSEREFLVDRYLHPMPRLALSEALRSYASAALDISDGFLKDLSRMAGKLGFALDFGRIPLSKAAAHAVARDPSTTQIVLGGGDDYELLIAVPTTSLAGFTESARISGVAITDLGVLTENVPLQVVGLDGSALLVEHFGYDHFSR